MAGKNVGAVMTMFFIVATVVIFNAVNGLMAYKCNVKEEAYERRTVYHTLGGCFVQLDDGTYIESDKYRIQIEDQ